MYTGIVPLRQLFSKIGQPIAGDLVLFNLITIYIYSVPMKPCLMNTPH